MKVAPRPRIGVLVLVAHLAVFYGIWALTRVDYNAIGDSSSTLFKWYVSPLLGGAVVLVIAASMLGWWRPALFETTKAQPRWLLVGPIFMAASAAVMLAMKDFSRTTAAMFLLALAGSLLVGFCEEMATRGLLVVGLRGGYTEVKVWLLSTLLFGLLHLPNWIFGAGPGAVMQVFIAFLGGTMFYVTRRVTGTLIWAMALHGFWDFSQFVGKTESLLGVPLSLLNGALALVLVAVLLRRESRVPAEPALATA